MHSDRKWKCLCALLGVLSVVASYAIWQRFVAPLDTYPLTEDKAFDDYLRASVLVGPLAGIGVVTLAVNPPRRRLWLVALVAWRHRSLPPVWPLPTATNCAGQREAGDLFARYTSASPTTS